MGDTAQVGSERADTPVAEIHRTLLPGARGECLEAAGDGTRLHLGCGFKRWAGWINVDIRDDADVVSDLIKLPFDDDHADEAIAVHVIEHFYLWDIPAVLREWLRVLKPGGKLTLELPCMDKVINYMAECLANRRPLEARMTWFALWGDPGYKSVAMCHKWGYIKAQIEQELLLAGFENVRFEEPRYHLRDRDMRVAGFKPMKKETV